MYIKYNYFWNVESGTLKKYFELPVKCGIVYIVCLKIYHNKLF